MTDTGTAPAVTDGARFTFTAPPETIDPQISMHLHLTSAERFNALAQRLGADVQAFPKSRSPFRSLNATIDGQRWTVYGPPDDENGVGQDTLHVELAEAAR